MRRFSASPRPGPSASQGQASTSQLRFRTLCVAASPETPGPAASDTELGKQSETPLSLRSWLAAPGRKPVCSRYGIAHLGDLCKHSLTQSSRVSLSVCIPCVHVYPSLPQEALVPTPVVGRTRIREPGWRAAKPPGEGVNRGAWGEFGFCSRLGWDCGRLQPACSSLLRDQPASQAQRLRALTLTPPPFRRCTPAQPSPPAAPPREPSVN